MLEWFKDKLSSGPKGNIDQKAAEELLTQFESVEKAPNMKPRVSERLVSFVLTGEPEQVLSELSALKSSGTTYTTYYFAGRTQTKISESLNKLVKLLPEDPALYLRLARVYDVIRQNGLGVLPFGHTSPIPRFDGSLSWLGTFLAELSNSGNQRDGCLPASLIHSMLTGSGEDPEHLIRGAFFYEDTQGKSQISRWTNSPYSHFHCLIGFPELVATSPGVVQPAFQHKESSSRAMVLRALAVLRVPPEPFAEEIATLSISGSKEVRESAEHFLANHFSILQTHLRAKAEKGSSDERFHSVRALARFGGNEQRAFLEQRLAVEKSEKVAEAIRNELGDSSTQSTTQADNTDHFNLSTVVEVPVKAPLDKQVLADIRACLEEFERKAEQDFSRNAHAQQSTQQWKPLDRKTAEGLYEGLQTFQYQGNVPNYFSQMAWWGNAFQTLKNFGAHPQFELIHLVRWCMFIWAHGISNNPEGLRRNTLTYWWRETFLKYQKSRKKPIDLRELAAAYKAVGLDDRTIGEQTFLIFLTETSPFLRSDAEAIWPYFAERADLLEEALGIRPTTQSDGVFNFWETHKRRNAFAILSLFPKLPARFVPLLWDLALGKAKTERPLAQECLNREADHGKIVAALSSKQQDARLAAAQWLGELKYQPAIPGLHKVLAKEKNELVKDELIKSLQTLGVKLEDILDLEKLDEEADKGLNKGIPSDLDWFPLNQLPAVRWADSNKEVRKEILHWFLVQGYKLKNAEANPTLRRYCSLFNVKDREQLGRFVMDAWIAEDTKPKYTAEQAASKAQLEAQQTAAIAKQYPQYYPDFDEQRTYQTAFNRYLVQPEGSQTATKGILAVAGACCGSYSGPIFHKYNKQWYGYRGAQSKALLQVLEWIHQPGATQVILSVANRFRTKGIQEEAVRLCQLLADRKGWTLDELADRTIPTCGFDEDGTMELDFGPRTFKALISDEMNITVTNPAGKTISSLPDANQSDDPEKAKSAKSALSAARKELKSVLTMQRDRLYEALCTQRTWSYEDWDAYLRKHPIVGRYCQRLVWTAYENDKVTASFRPLADGSLTNYEDDEVQLNPATMIRLAHDETLSSEDSASWLQHLSDYKIEPLFQQFGKMSFVLPEELKEATEITQFLGHLIKAFSLRNRLTRLGYLRGAAQDAGWFLDYRKTFLSLGIEAVIDFTGNSLPEENRLVALLQLHFERKNVAGEQFSESLTLGELPRVLLSECWNDIRMAAADGSGFAPDWEKQTEI